MCAINIISMFALRVVLVQCILQCRYLASDYEMHVYWTDKNNILINVACKWNQDRFDFYLGSCLGSCLGWNPTLNQIDCMNSPRQVASLRCLVKCNWTHYNTGRPYSEPQCSTQSWTTFANISQDPPLRTDRMTSVILNNTHTYSIRKPSTSTASLLPLLFGLNQWNQLPQTAVNQSALEGLYVILVISVTF